MKGKKLLLHIYVDAVGTQISNEKFYNFLIYITIKQVYNKRKTSDKFGDILSSHF